VPGAKKLIVDASDREVRRLKKELAIERRRSTELARALDETTVKAKHNPIPVKPRKSKAARHLLRVIIPDSHGLHIDLTARDAFLADLARLDPDEIVWLGDHLDAGGTFNAHQRNYTHEMTESYADDVAATNEFIDKVQARAPNAESHYIYGNHEWHVERWATRNFESFKDALLVLDRLGPAAVLKLQQRGFKWYLPSERYQGLSVPGTIKIGKCHFTHGMSHSEHAAATHLRRVGANVVFGHVHRMQSVCERTVSSDGFGAWCPGTLAKLQPLYRHTAPTSWQHGYAVQFANQNTGQFIHWNIPIMRGVSLLLDVIDAVGERARKRK
jgi:signal recognition particle subunit SEC65